MSKKKPVKKGASSTKRVVSAAPAKNAQDAKTSKQVVGTVAPSPTSKQVPSQTQVVLPFTRKNYILLLIGIGIIALGFILLSLDDFVDAREFSISLYIAPIVIVAGFLEIIYAIMYRDKSELSADA